MLNPINYTDYLDEEYYEFLNGKKVAIVGPAAYLAELSSLEMGKYIDSHDIVVRVNRGMELISKHSKNMGKKTDLVYNCFIEGPDNGGTINIDVMKQAGIKWVATIPGSNIKGETTSNRLHKQVQGSTIQLVKKNFLFHVMDYHLYGHLNQQVESRANTGFAAIIDLLQHGVDRLFISGYSFYLDSFAQGYKDGCERSEKVFAKQCFTSKRHKQKEQWEFMKKLTQECDRIETDPILSRILSMGELSKEEFQDAYRNYIHSN